MSALVLGHSVVHYEYYGRGRPLVFNHGWLGSWRYWVPSMDAMSEEYRVYALDLWGFGDSDKSQTRYTLDAYADLVYSFVAELGIIGPIPLVGHALGAAVAVSFALEHPELVDRIMAVSLPVHAGSVNRRLLSGDVSLLDRMLGRTPTSGYDDIEQEMHRTAPGAIEQSLDSVLQFPIRSRLGELQVPLLLVYGEQDNVVAPPDPNTFNGTGQPTRVLMMPECRHFPMLDRSSQFNRLLLDFVLAPPDLQGVELKEEWQRRIR